MWKFDSFLKGLFFPIFFGIVLLISDFSWAANENSRSLIQQPRTLAMGGAGVGLADDEYALFQNPAGLGGSDRRQLKIIGISLEGSEDIYTGYSDVEAAWKDFSLESLNALSGKDISLRGGATPIFSFKQFAIAYVLDGQFSLNQFNQINPTFRLGAMVTQGVQAGIGHEIGGKRNSKDRFRIGFAAKALWRRGGHYDLPTSEVLTAVTNGGAAYLNNLMGPFSRGFGADLGFQYSRKISSRVELLAGTTLSHIGDLNFDGSQAQDIPMNWSSGLGLKNDFGLMSVTLALDYRNAFTKGAFSNRTHFGVDVGIPFFHFYAGINQLYPTYGLSFDIWITRITALSYGEELGFRFQQNPSRRYLLNVDFKLPI